MDMARGQQFGHDAVRRMMETTCEKSPCVNKPVNDRVKKMVNSAVNEAAEVTFLECGDLSPLWISIRCWLVEKTSTPQPF